MTNTLKPCPHCGGEADYYLDYIQCVRCLACSPYEYGLPHAEGKKKAIAAWNRRPPARALTLDELRGMEGKPVWVVWLGEFGDTPSGWEIAGKGCPIPAGGLGLRYGETWVAYDREPDAD